MPVVCFVCNKPLDGDNGWHPVYGVAVHKLCETKTELTPEQKALLNVAFAPMVNGCNNCGATWPNYVDLSQCPKCHNFISN